MLIMDILAPLFGSAPRPVAVSPKASPSNRHWGLKGILVMTCDTSKSMMGDLISAMSTSYGKQWVRVVLPASSSRGLTQA